MSWRLNLFLLHVSFRYYLCSRVNENLIELTLFSSVCIDMAGVPVGTRFQVIGLKSAEPASSGRHWINRFSQHEIVADLIIWEVRAPTLHPQLHAGSSWSHENSEGWSKDQQLNFGGKNSNILICSQKLFRCNRLQWVNYQLSLHHQKLTFEAPLMLDWPIRTLLPVSLLLFLLDHRPNYFPFMQTENITSSWSL